MSGRYTVWDDPRVDRFVEGHLNQIVAQITVLIGGDLEAIVLGGGFGRGEGSVLVDPDGSMHVVNDYDLEIVCREHWGNYPSKLINRVRFQKKLGQLEESLSSRLQIKQLDFGLRNTSDYVRATPRLADFDLKYGHRLLYGNRDPISAMPDFKPTDIPPFEGTWLLRNRGLGLLLARLYFQNGEIPAIKSENFYIEITKAILAMGDALFILSGRYVCSYTERAARFHELAHNRFSSMPELSRLYPLAAQYKLRPRVSMYPDMPPMTLWHHIVRLYVTFFLFYESQRLKRTIASTHEYAEWATCRPATNLQQYPRWVFERISGMVRGFSPQLVQLKHDKPRGVLFVISLLDCRQNECINNKPAQLVWRLLGENFEGMTEQQWKRIVRDFLLLIHPGGEVGRYLAAK